MTGSVRQAKSELREELMKLRDSFSQEEREKAEKRMTELFFSLASVRYAKNLLLYSPIKSEPDVSELAERGMSLGKRVALPVSDPSEPKMEYFFIDGEGRLEKGAFGIPEPSKDSERYEGDGALDICVVPAVAFDRKGHRLGYGKGYYDRFLSGFMGVKVGLCMSSLLLDSLPSGRFDVPVNVIITEKGVLIPNEK